VERITVTLGKTGLTVNKNGFGALPLQRISETEAVRLLHKAYDGGIDFYDTARFYTDSEIKLGKAFGSNMRQNVIIASKSMARNVNDLLKDLETTLRNLRTDYLDLYQFHNPPFCPLPNGEDGLYNAMIELVKKGQVRHFGITNHSLAVAHQAVDSNLYDTLQFPFNYLSGEKELDLVLKCKALNIGFIAMKSLSGGLITNSFAAYVFLAGYDNVLPIWGIQKEKELDEFLNYINNPPAMNDDIKNFIHTERKELAGEFCRGCGYCMPCPQGIEIFNCARMSLLLRRSPSELQLTPEVQAKMHKIKDCTRCNSCSARCPYNLDTPTLLRKNYDDYLSWIN